MSATHLYCFHVGWACASWPGACAPASPCPPGAPCPPSAPCGAESLCAMSGSLLDEVDEREDRDPHDVDEVPVQRGNVDVDRIGGAEATLVIDREQCA